MNFIKIIFIVSLFISCNKQKEKTIRADLTFKSISFASFYGVDDNKYKSLLNEIDSTLKNPTSENETVKLYRYFKNLEKHNLLRKPYIFLKTKKDSTITVLLDEKEYEKVKYFKHSNLFKENKKVVIEIEIQEKEPSIFYSNNIIKVSKEKGESRSNMN